NINQLSSGKHYKDLVNARHGKAAKILGVNKVGLNAHIKQSAVGNQKHKFKAGRYGKILKGVNYVSAVITLGVEIYSAIMKIKQCRAIADNARNGLIKIRKAKAELDRVYNNINGYITLVDTRGFQYIKGQLAGQNFLLELVKAKDLLKAAGKQSANLTRAAGVIQNYLANIRDANSRQTYQLSKALAGALSQVKFLYDCYVNKLRLVNYVSERCKNGTKALSVLYAEAIISFNTGGIVNDKTCKNDAGVAYFTAADMQKNWDVKAKLLKLSSDCILNSKAKKLEACRLFHPVKYPCPVSFSKLKKDLVGKDQIARDMGLSRAQVDALTANCPLTPLTPKEKGQVCRLHAIPWTPAFIASFMSVDISLVEAQIKKCGKGGR
ncbi:hypothetical protein QZH41_013978, partial [Actinostola sp. cb2023]